MRAPLSLLLLAACSSSAPDKNTESVPPSGVTDSGLDAGDDEVDPADAGDTAGSGSADDTGDTEIVLPNNIYLDAVVEWNPGSVGASRVGWNDMVDDSGVPIENGHALGAPTGFGPTSSGPGNLAVGIDGEAVFRFAEGWAVVDGEGDDFVTFQCNFAFGNEADRLINELGRVAVSDTGTDWYVPATVVYQANPTPGEITYGYAYAGVEGLHGTEPTWANHTMAVQAHLLEDGYWVPNEGVEVPPDFTPDAPNLGGSRFDLANFVHEETGAPFPDGGRVHLLRLTDDSTILDGQDYLPEWSLGAHINAAMGISVLEE